MPPNTTPNMMYQSPFPPQETPSSKKKIFWSIFILLIAVIIGIAVWYGYKERAQIQNGISTEQALKALNELSASRQTPLPTREAQEKDLETLSEMAKTQNTGVTLSEEGKLDALKSLNK